MAGGWSRVELSAHVDVLAERHEGEAFVSEIAAFAKSLDANDRALLEEILLARAQREEDVGKVVHRPAEEKGWLRRTLGRAEDRVVGAVRRRGG